MTLPLTDEFLVNSRTASTQAEAEITTLANGRFVITWTDFSQGFGGPQNAPTGTGIDVRAQVFEADGTPVGLELTVNSTFDRSQENPRIAALTGGGFVIVFDDDSLQPDGGTGPIQAGTVRAQIYDDNGTRIGTEIIVNTASNGRQHTGVPVALADGGFAVTWIDGDRFAPGSLGVGGAGGDTDAWAIKMQVFEADGTPRGTEQLVNTSTIGHQSDPRAIMLDNGNFVITWTDGANVDGRAGSAPFDPASGRSGLDDVRAQIFDPTGAMVGTEILVNTTIYLAQRLQKIVALDGGGFVIAWESYAGTAFSEINAQVFAADGTRIGGEITVNTQRQDEQEEPEIAALVGGGFVIAWIDDSPERYESGAAIPVRIKAQVLAADGTPVGSEIMVSLPAPGPNSQSRHKIAALGDGGFVIVWNAGSSDFNRDIYARTFGADGTPSSDEILVNQATEGGQISPEVTAVGLSGFVVTWEDDSRGVGGAGGDTNREAIKSRVFGPDPNPPLELSGTAGNDLLTGGGGNDTILGGEGADTILGGAGDDSINAGFGFDSVHGGAGDDFIQGLNGFDTLMGDDGNDTLQGNAGDDVLFGGNGDDMLYGGIGADTLHGDDGADVLIGLQGYDMLHGGAGNDTLRGNEGNDMIHGGADDDLIEGGIGADTLFGDDGDDLLLGNNGFDDLYGGDGNDRLEGNAGDDTLDGGLGNDVLRGGNGADVFVFRVGYGQDRIADFQNNIDMVQIDAALLGLAAPVPIDLIAFAGRTTEGFLILDFGNGDTLTFTGVTNTGAILDEVVFI